MRHLRLISLVSLLLLPSVSAAQAQSFYFSAFVDRQSLNISSSSFAPIVGSVVLGFWGWEGIGLEAELGGGLADSSVGDLDLEISSMAALNVRLESPPIDRIAAYVQFGVVRSNIDSRFSGPANSSLDTTFSGPRLAIGLTFQLTPAWQFDAGFSRHEYDDDLGINSFRAGLRFSTGIGFGRYRR